MRYAILFLFLVTSAYAQSAGEMLCTEVLRYYPLEFLDQEAWWESCRNASERSVESLLNELDDPLGQILDEPPVSAVEYHEFEVSTTGYLRVSGFRGGAEFVALFDAELEKARFDDGLMIDLRGAGGGDIETAYQCFARLINAPQLGVRIAQRLPGSEESMEIKYQLKPRGEWQFEAPVVLLVDEGTYWPCDALLLAARERTQMESVGRPTFGTKAVAPRDVQLAHRVWVQIPTARAWTSDDILFEGQPIAPGINMLHEPRTLYRNPSDPILSRGADELYRLIGRLDWLQNEERKRLLEEELRKKK